MKNRRFVVDTNRLFAAIIRDSLARMIILHPDFHFITPVYIVDELVQYKDYLYAKSKLSESAMNQVLEMLLSRIELIHTNKITSCINKAKEIMDKIDPDDMLFVALALCSDVNGIWTEDKDFLKQDVVPIFRTKDLFRLIIESKK